MWLQRVFTVCLLFSLVNANDVCIMQQGLIDVYNTVGIIKFIHNINCGQSCINFYTENYQDKSILSFIKPGKDCNLPTNDIFTTENLFTFDQLINKTQNYFVPHYAKKMHDICNKNNSCSSSLQSITDMLNNNVLKAVSSLPSSDTYCATYVGQGYEIFSVFSNPLLRAYRVLGIDNWKSILYDPNDLYIAQSSLSTVIPNYAHLEAVMLIAAFYESNKCSFTNVDFTQSSKTKEKCISPLDDGTSEIQLETAMCKQKFSMDNWMFGTVRLGINSSDLGDSVDFPRSKRLSIITAAVNAVEKAASNNDIIAAILNTICNSVTTATDILESHKLCCAETCTSDFCQNPSASTYTLGCVK